MDGIRLPREFIKQGPYDTPGDVVLLLLLFYGFEILNFYKGGGI
jgi:hypothetical protein